MGKPAAETTSEQAPIIHFSHIHPLQLLNLPTLGPIPPCSACKLDASGPIYACTTCNFILHPKCYQLPQQITHPFDRKHALVLYPKPVYPEALFRCDACGNQGAGFSYHCSPCGVDLHTTCASLPMLLTHNSHQHPLNLTFSSPYPGNSFSCDICKKVTSKTWIYRCAACEFDVHLTCVATVIPRPQSRPSYGVSRPPQPAVAGHAQNMFVEMPQINNTAYNSLNQPGYGAPRPVNGLGDKIVLEAVNGVASGVAQSATQAIIQGFFGGGGGGGGSGGGVNQVDTTGMGGGGATVDEVSYYDGGYGGADGGYNGEDCSY
ncbi:hypothetical protein ACS0TY_019868 [Phlomoides rotata]